jgi:hypothetical protein
MTDCHLMMYVHTIKQYREKVASIYLLFLFFIIFFGGLGRGGEEGTLKLLYKPYVLACGI